MTSPHLPGRWSTASRLLIGLFLMVILGLLAWRHLASLLTTLNADDFYLPALYKDLLTERYDLTNWHLPPAPYFFPDLPVFFILNSLLPDLGYAFSLYGLLSVLAYSCLFFYLARRISGEGYVSFLVIVSLVILLLALSIPGHLLGKFTLHPSLHSSAFLVGLTLTAITLNALERGGYSRRETLAFFVLAFLTTASDSIIIVQFLIPLPLALTVLRARNLTTWKLVRTSFVLSAGAILASMLLIRLLRAGEWLHMPNALRWPGWAYVQQSLHFFSRDLGWMLENWTTLMVLGIFGVVTGLACLILNRNQPAANESDPGPQASRTVNHGFLALLTTISFAATMSAPVSRGIWLDINQVRYLLPGFFMPLFLIVLTIVPYHRRLPRALKFILVGLVVGLGLRIAAPTATGLDLEQLTLPYPDRIKCLDDLARRHNLKFGFSDYWNAKYVSFFSRAGLRVNQLNPDLGPFLWINNLAWYYGRKRGGRCDYPDYGFIITNGLSREVILKEFGPPTLVEYCGENEIFVYDRSNDFAIKNLHRDHLLELCRGASSSYAVKPKNLGRRKFEGTTWNADGITIIRDEKPIPVRLIPAAQGEFFELGADSDDEYEVVFFQGQAVLGRLVIPGVAEKGAGIRSRIIELPDNLKNRPVDKLEIKPLKGDGRHSVGHLFFHPALGSAAGRIPSF
ncbi:MAG: hypothetical protein AB1641_22305 [Thermodesulfobacteriota bacterium]